MRIAGRTVAGVSRLRFNGDTGNNYSYTTKADNAAVISATNAAGINVASVSTAGTRYFSVSVRNVLSQAKAVIIEGASNSESAGTAPTINASRGVWGNTSAQITSVTLNDGPGTADLLAGTEMWVWGSD